MIRNKILSLSFILVVIASNSLIRCDEEGYFTVVGRNLMNFQETYRVVLTYQGYTKYKKFQIGIKEVKENSTGYEVYERVGVKGDGVEDVFIDTRNQPKGRYVLEVKALTGKNFNQSVPLHMNLRKFVTFIQTDKSIYKPGDTVKFRVFVVDHNTYPYEFQDIEVFITDGARNRVKVFEDPKSKFFKGVYRNELQLSEQPVLGTWKINVNVNNESATSKEFEVNEYVLPKFELTMDTEPANFKDGRIRATVKAKYTFGKMAKGTATVTAKFRKGHYDREERKYVDESVIVTKQIDVDGKKFVDFDLFNELKMNKSSYERYVTLSATFVEELTQKEVNVSKSIYVTESPFKIEFTKSADKIKPGLPFTVKARVLHHNKDMPVTDTHHPVKFDIKYKYNIMRKCIRQEYPEWFDPYFRFHKRNETVTQRPLTADDIVKTEYECREIKSIDEVKEVFPKDGIAELPLEVFGNITDIQVDVSYLDARDYSNFIPRAESAHNKFIKLEAKVSGNRYLFRITSNTKVNRLFYKVVGSSGYLSTNSERYDKILDEYIGIYTYSELGSSMRFIVFSITEDGEFISDSMEFDLKHNYNNHINLELSQEQVQPGDNVTITVDTEPNSFVGLLGVDQSVFLLKSGNDFDEVTLKRELERFEDYDIYNYRRYGDAENSEYYEYFDRNLVIISNAKGTKRSEYIPIYYNETIDLPLEGYPSKGIYLESAVYNRGGQSDFDRDSVPIVGSAFNAGAGGAGSRPMKIRKEFPETWLFEDIDMGNSNKHVLTKKVPDSITSWIITGFSLNPDAGLCVTKEATKLNVFQPFFVSTNLPYSIKRGEVVSIPFAVFNYLGTDQNVVVKFFNSDREFEFVEVNVAENSVSRQKRALEKERTKEILVKSNKGTSVSFIIRPLKAGHITIKVTAESQLAGDGVERQLKVEPEGVPQYFNEAVFVDLRNQKDFKKDIQVTVLSEAVEDSTRIEASVIGDILGPTLENLDNLIQLPYGCAEQNMLKFVPNILVLEYLTNLNKLNPETEAKLKKHLDVGYQKQLTYKNAGGSYSGFGMKTEKGSTWLTAYVAKSFNQASKYIDIDQEVITDALDFLSSIQSENGSFPEFGHVSYTPMQGGASKGIGLTAYTLITFLENKQHIEKYKDTIQKALDYVVDNVGELDDDIYALAIASYALQLAGHEKKDVLFAKLNKKAEATEGMKYWKKEVVEDEGSGSARSPWFYRRRSTVNVEMTSYAMLTFILAGHDQEAIPIMKWLVSQRNYRGGFQSTQDTVVGLQALSQLASKIPFSNNQMRISVKPQNSAQARWKSFDLNSKNSLILQKAELPSSSRTFEVTADGTGFAILQISYRYNLDNSGKHPRFNLMPTVDSTSNKEFLNLKVCTNFVPDSQDDKSNMAIMEVTLPSGFTFDNDHLTELMTTDKVKKVETKDGDTVIMVYFADIGSKDICPSFHAYRTHAVANHKPAPIVVYDYYDNSRHARAFYNPPEISLCDICQGADDCKDACEVPTAN